LFWYELSALWYASKVLRREVDGGAQVGGAASRFERALAPKLPKIGSSLSTSEVILFYQNMYCLHTCGPAVLPDWAQVELPFMHRHPRVNDVDKM
jgi:hypothetical protein